MVTNNKYSFILVMFFAPLSKVAKSMDENPAIKITHKIKYII